MRGGFRRRNEADCGMVIFLMLLKRLKSVKVSPSVLSSPGFCFVCFLFLLKHLIYRLTTWRSQLIRSFCELEVLDFRLLSRFVQFFTLCAIAKDFLLFFIFQHQDFLFLIMLIRTAVCSPAHLNGCSIQSALCREEK